MIDKKPFCDLENPISETVYAAAILEELAMNLTSDEKEISKLQYMAGQVLKNAQNALALYYEVFESQKKAA